ncbi:hypothetical protein Hanom_Chr16g01445921 [Helianthus anomalus]
MTILVRVCRLFSSPIPMCNFTNNGVSLMSKCRNCVSFEKLRGNLVSTLQPKRINVSKLKRLPTFSGNTSILVLDKLRYLKCFKRPMKSGTSII